MERQLARIRSETAALHEELERLPYARAVMDASIPVALYASFLRAVAIVHDELDKALLMHPELRSVASARSAHRRELLEQDLAALQLSPLATDAAGLQALVLGQELRLLALRDPLTLLGHAYVLEGSQLGSAGQHQALQKRADLQGALRYLGSTDTADFKAFASRLTSALDSEEKTDAAVRGAVAHFEGFRKILEALDPVRAPAQRLSAQINSDAGNHPMPEALREVRAALLAGERSWAESPYYFARYGERGRRFTRSDSGWLVTIGREDFAVAQRQVGWLSRVLSARGMPSILLERHLQLLRDELLKALPDNAYPSLEAAAAQLGQERLSFVPAFDELVEQAAARLSGGPLSPRECATLLVGAAADEKRGIAEAAPSLTAWLCDSSRASSAFITEADATLRAARR
ncbi:MAG TPA: biliverdin-producing heme oxygenase [Myxococcales bacterium]|jgi:heme oxygenase